MKTIYSLLLTLALLAPAAALAQDTPGTVKFPSALDTADSLIRASNSARTTLSGSLTPGATTVTVVSAASFPSSGAAMIDNEVIFYSGKTSTTLTGVTRGADSTTAASHSSGAAVRGVIAAAHHNTLASAAIATQGKLGTGSSAPSSGTVLRGTGAGASAWGTLTSSELPSSPTFSGVVTAGSFVGNGAGLTGIGTGTGGVLNTGSTTVGADTDVDGVGILDFQTRGVTRLRINNDGTLDVPGGFSEAVKVVMGVGAVNLAAKATAGDGSTGSPYTGWTSALSLSASDTAYYFPAKTFSFSTPLVFTGERVKIRCEPGAVLKFTGAGVALTSDGGAVTGDVNGVDIVGCKLVGNASATKGVYLRSSHRGYYDLEITDFSQAGLETAFAVGSDFRVKVSRHSSEPFTVTPVNGLVFGARGAGEGTHAGNVWPVVEWVSGDGIVCNSCHSMVFHAGTSEGNGGRGRYFSPTSTQNTIIGADDEANVGDDLTLAGNHNKIVNFFSNKAGGSGVVRITGDYNTIDGGVYDSVIIESTAAETQIDGGPSYNASGTGTITDSSTTTRWHTRFYNFTTGGYYIPNFDLTPAAGWSHAGGSWSNVGYYKRGDMVFLRGCASGGAGTIATLPAGARPAGDRAYSVRTGATPASGTVAINSVGAIILASGTANLVCLDGVYFDLP